MQDGEEVLMQSLCIFYIRAVCFSSICFLPLQIYASQDGVVTTELTRPKVGLVLSGGGARGAAHVGVLKVLEEKHIPIDVISGTSFGAIVGGLYACGYTPAQIEHFFISKELQTWMQGGSNSKEYYLFKAEEPNASWQMFKITFDSVLRVKLPTNIISPDEMDFRLLELFTKASASADYNFDNLYIPFRCLASDISDNESVVFNSGEVDKAIRASMTFPFYLKPIRINGKLMFDGGMYNNFPSDVLKDEFEPEIIIGSKAASNYGPPDDDDIISQIQSMLMANTKYTVDSANGVLIVPNLKSVNLTDFSNSQEFIDSGYVATMQQIPRIKEMLKVSKSKEERITERDKFSKKKPEFQVGKISYKGINQKQEVYLNRLIRDKKVIAYLQDTSFGYKEKMDHIKKQYYKLLGEEKIESVSPELIYNPELGFYNLIFNIDKSNRVDAEIGGLLTSNTTNQIFFQLNFSRWTKYILKLSGNTYLGRFHNSVQGKMRFDVPTSLPLAFEFSYTFNSWNFFNTSTYFFEDEQPNYLVERDSYGRVSISTPVSKFSKLSFEYVGGKIQDRYYQTNQFSRTDTTDKTTFYFNSPGISFEYNSLNRKQFPSKGIYARLCVRYISGNEETIPGSTSTDTTNIFQYHDWVQFRMYYNNYFLSMGKFNMGFHLSLTWSNQPSFSNFTATALAAPAFQPIPESQTLFLPQFRAHKYGAAGLMVIYTILKNFDVRAEGYLFQPYREIKQSEDKEATYGEIFSDRSYIFSGTLVYHAAFGPISMCFNYYDPKEDPFSFSLNIGYYIFNKRPFQ